MHTSSHTPFNSTLFIDISTGKFVFRVREHVASFCDDTDGGSGQRSVDIHKQDSHEPARAQFGESYVASTPHNNTRRVAMDAWDMPGDVSVPQLF